VKTRLCPPLSPAQAAGFAAACLVDTLDAVERLPWTARVLALDLPDLRWSRPGWVQMQQAPGPLDERIADAMARTQQLADGAPVLLVGMDTPHLRTADLHRTQELLGDHDAVLGPADDGGWWALGLRRVDPALVRDVPMSTPVTATVQLLRLLGAGLSVGLAPSYRDIDTVDDAVAAAAACPGAGFAAALRRTGAA
jgi:glycosyltransferase A (GT-A) superfamily protein (DUF2064 family)